MNHLEILKKFQAWRRGDDFPLTLMEAKPISEAIDWAIRELDSLSAVHVQRDITLGTMQQTIEHWQSEHAKEKKARLLAQEQLADLRHEWQRYDLCLQYALQGKKRGDEGDRPLLDLVRDLKDRADAVEGVELEPAKIIHIGFTDENHIERARTTMGRFYPDSAGGQHIPVYMLAKHTNRLDEKTYCYVRELEKRLAHPPAPTVPEGWSITEDELEYGYVVRGPGVAYCVWRDQEPWLYSFLEAILSANHIVDANKKVDPAQVIGDALAECEWVDGMVSIDELTAYADKFRGG